MFDENVELYLQLQSSLCKCAKFVKNCKNKKGNKKLNVHGMAQGNIKVNLTNGKAIFDNVNPIGLRGVMVKANNMDIIEKSNSFIGPLDLNGGEYYPAI